MPSDVASRIEGILAAKLACSLSVRVKNTFIEVWDGGSEDKAAAPHRPFCTCPELSGAYEPESELSPAQPSRGSPAGAAAAPQDQGLLFHLLGGAAEAARAVSKGGSEAEPAPERSPRWADLMEEVTTPTGAPAADHAADGAERARPQDAFSALLEWEPAAPLAFAPPGEPESLPAEDAAAAAGHDDGRGAEGGIGGASGSERRCGADPQASQDAGQPVPRKGRSRGGQRHRLRAAARASAWAQAEGRCSGAEAASGPPEERAATGAAEEPAPVSAAPSCAEAPCAVQETAPEPAAPSYAEVALRGRSCRQQQQQQQQRAVVEGQVDRELPPAGATSHAAEAAADILRLLRCEQVPEPAAAAEADAAPEAWMSRAQRRRRHARAHAESEASCAGAPASEPAAPACPGSAREGAPACADAAREGTHSTQRQLRRAAAHRQAEPDLTHTGAASWVAKAPAPERAAAACAAVAREGAPACADATGEGERGGWRQRRLGGARGQAEAVPECAGAGSRAAEAAEAGAAAPGDADAADGASRVARGAKDHSEDSQVQPVRACPAGRNNRNKLWCHLYLSEDMLKRGFDLNKKVIGHGGQCTKGIFDVTGAKIRLRGRGSGHLEGPRWREAPVHLMLAVTVEKGEAENFRTAVRMAAEHLRDIEGRFHGFCRQRGLPPPKRCCFWVGEISANGRACLGSILDDIPQDAEVTKGASEER